MARLNKGRQHLIEGNRKTVFFCEFNHGSVKRLNFRPPPCFHVLQHTAVVVFGAGQDRSQVVFKRNLVGNSDPLQARTRAASR